MYLLIWFLISLTIFGLFLWSTGILESQKKAWKQFAEKHGFQYNQGRKLASAVVNGTEDPYDVRLFSSREQDENARIHSFITIMELSFPNPMNQKGLIATTGYESDIEDVSFLERLNEHPLSKQENLFLLAENAETMQAFLTPKRISAIKDFLRLSKAPKMILFTDDRTVMEFQTVNPLDNLGQIEKLYKRLQNIAGRIAA